MTPKNIFDFTKNANIDQWFILDDGVMGGLSQGSFSINEDGHGWFHGDVSLKNNGGFSSLRFRPDTIELEHKTKFILRLKGDGSNYQFRVSSSLDQRFSYVAEFETSGEWENIEIIGSEMYPSFRGRKLNRPNYDFQNLSELGFLIGNKKAQSFSLLIDKIEVE